MNSFPLFDSLYNDTEDKDLSSSQKKIFMKKMEIIDMNGMELIYALICSFQESNNEGNSFIVPYDGKYIGNDITFDLDQLPLKLKQIIYKFILMHIKKIDEDNKLEKKRLSQKPK
jgi:hypothetical protein